MSLITDALRKADSSLSTSAPPTQIQTQEPPPSPRAELPQAPPEQTPGGIRLSHGLLLILCIAAGSLWFGHRSSATLRSQKIEVVRFPRTVTRPPQVDSSEKPAETAQDPFSTALSPQTASRLPSVKSASAPEINPAAVTAGTKIGMEMIRSVETSQWRLNGIIRGGAGKPLALVNNELVQEGDSFHGARVARVSDDQVVLDTNGQTQTLRLD